ncbi:MAG: inositol monophosphatase [Dehalococcoidia bacterium]|jgi:myo-inositol-1(or 4)-monophosphatase|nr:inositol monophosphatase [Dehalococcoidia bacterium]
MIESKATMDEAFLERVERDATEFARGAGALLLEHFRRPLDVQYKSANRRDPVTEADKKAEAFLRDSISASYPDHGIVGEEDENTEHETPEFAWVLDPLDGTTNFLNGLPVFASSIGVLRRGVPVAAALFIPGIEPGGGSVYHARLNGGAFQDDRRLAVTDNPQPERGRLTGFPSFWLRMYAFNGGLRQRLGEVRSLGSIAFEMAMTSRGSFQMCMFTTPKIWDVAGGALLVNEAGGKVLTRTRRNGAWHPLEGFRPDAPTLDNLREWRGAVVAGNEALTAHVGQRVRQRSFAWFRFRRWLRQKAGLNQDATGAPLSNTAGAGNTEHPPTSSNGTGLTQRETRS